MTGSQNNWKLLQHINRLIAHRGGFASGCLIAIIAGVLVLVGAGIYVVMNFNRVAAEGIAVAMNIMIEHSDLPQEEKSEIIEILDQLKEGYQAGEITLEELGLIFESMGSCPALAIGVMTHFEASYVEPSSLSDGEKITAKLDLNRFAQGLSSGLIGWEEIGEVSAPIMASDEEGNQNLREPTEITDDEIREVLAAVKYAADDAGISRTIVEIDISDEFKKTIEEALERPLT
jgi:hypothetical protein